MWAIVENGVITGVRGNLISHDLANVLAAQYPGAVIWRAKTECVESFNRLAFAKEWVKVGEKERVDVDGNRHIDDVLDVQSVGNTYHFEDSHIVVRDKMGVELACFEMEIAHDGNAFN